MENEMDEPFVYRSLSENQKKLVAVLPIPSAILSLIGSSSIVYMAMRSRRNPTKKWTPYNRLIMGMSCFDILTSVTMTVASFLYPKETSNKAWVIGNETTCSIVGALNQLIYGVILYYGSLSIYFLLTARFGISNAKFAHRIEPFMHIFCFGYPLVTAFVGLFLDVYNEPEIGLGCWIKRWPKRCISYRDPVGSEEQCRSEEVAWALGGWVAGFTLVMAFISTVVLFVHVLRHEKVTKPVKKTCEDDRSFLFKTERTCEDDRSSLFKTEMMSSMILEQSESSEVDPSSTQFDDRREHCRRIKRLKLVRNQALFYFLSFFMTSGWPQWLRLVESQTESMVEEKELPYDYYCLLLLSCIMFPLQGFTNLIVFIRPKYVALRAEHPNEPRLWALKRTIFEDKPMAMNTSPTNAEPVADNTRTRQLDLSMPDGTSQQPPSSIEDNDTAPRPRSPRPYGKAVSTGAFATSYCSMASTDEEMSKVMERSKRRLERYKADRLTKTPSSSSLHEVSEPDGPSSVELMSPIRKVRVKLKVQTSGILDSSDCESNEEEEDEEETLDYPRPVPETMEPIPMPRGKGKPVAIQMDGSIVHRDSR